MRVTKFHDGVQAMDRKDALKKLGISQEEDDKLQERYSKGDFSKKAKTVKNHVKYYKQESEEEKARIDVLEEKVKLIMNFLCI